MKTKRDLVSFIASGKTVMGLELGTTRIKAVLTDERSIPIASGSFMWKSRFIDNNWTYDLDEVEEGLKSCYQSLKSDVLTKYGVVLKKIKAIGVSAMMHGYLAFDKDDHLLTPFRTWQNNDQKEAADALTELFGFNIPQRWTIAHLYTSMLRNEPYLKDVSKVTTLASYVHYRLTGRYVIGVGDASGVFPITTDGNYDKEKADLFDGILKSYKLPYSLKEILPKPLIAGSDSGILTKDGASLLDPEGDLEEGSVFCPPEGDAQTGIISANGISPRRGNVSAGTSVFAMVVLEKPLQKVHREIDMVVTPMSIPLAMVHSNNCTIDINSWASLFENFLSLLNINVSRNELYSVLFRSALDGDRDSGDILTYSFVAGEDIVNLREGRPLLIRKPESRFTVSNLMKANLFSSLASLRIGMDVLKSENVVIDSLIGHGGFFKTPDVGQIFMSSALNIPISVTEEANEGGPWGASILASYMVNNDEGYSLEKFLDKKVFGNVKYTSVEPDPEYVSDFEKYLERFKESLLAEKMLLDTFR